MEKPSTLIFSGKLGQSLLIKLIWRHYCTIQILGDVRRRRVLQGCCMGERVKTYCEEILRGEGIPSVKSIYQIYKKRNDSTGKMSTIPSVRINNSLPKDDGPSSIIHYRRQTNHAICIIYQRIIKRLTLCVYLLAIIRHYTP